jgi:phosphoglucosamine mutase
VAPRFGTDGIRGTANQDLTPELVLALGRAAARHLPGGSILIGRDTRRSGPMLGGALAAGFAAEGTDVVDVGVIPTPGLAYLAARRGVPAAMISASHNPYRDNGIKLLSPAGSKLPDGAERAIEAELDALVARQPPGAVGSGVDHPVGTITTEPHAVDEYIEHLVAIGSHAGPPLKVVIDCANGAASVVAPEVLRRLGHEVTVRAAEPDGTNINAECGSTHPLAAAKLVRELGADVGLAFDGDADRLIAIDERGAVIDGDELIALFALDLAAAGTLTGDGVVVTVMSNLGLRRALESRGLAVVETTIGDRAVVEGLEREGYVLGGEQSGHIVFRDRATTGDGVLTGLLLLSLLARADTRLSALTDGLVVRVPQELVTLPVTDRRAVIASAELVRAVVDAEHALGGNGRLLVRASGTEQAVRIMVETDDADLASTVVRTLSKVVGAVDAGLEATRHPA